MGIDSVVKNQALNQQIYTLLKQEILHHQLQPGERIVDAQVAARLGVSRTPAREAITWCCRNDGTLTKCMKCAK